MQPPRRLLIVLLAAAGLAVLPAAAGARTGSCLVPGSSAVCTVWTGKATFVDDGDTLRVDLKGDGTRAPIKVRVTGLQAMEQSVYAANPARRRGECHALEATARLEQLIARSRGRVRLAAQDPSSRSKGRWRRAVAVRIGGRWQDAGRRLLSEGHALWLPNRREYAWNAEYNLLAARAAAKGVGLWDPSSCGPGPSEGAQLQLLASTDADGSDRDFLNGEWVRIRNLDPLHEVPLGGWRIRDSALTRFVFPSWATLPPGEQLVVHMGDGRNTWTEFFANGTRPVFENPGGGDRALGDGAYLFDPDGDLRASMVNPCREGCTHPYQGAIALEAKARGSEHVIVRNVSGTPIGLDGLRLHSRPHSYDFGRDALLAPGEELQVNVLGDAALDTRLERHWGKAGPILNDGGDAVRLGTYTGIEIACTAYGSKVC
jgi:endonuclease YncB( thermonuclease family)